MTKQEVYFPVEDGSLRKAALGTGMFVNILTML